MKKLLSTLLAMALVASLASCGSTDDSSSEKSSTSSSASSDNGDSNEEEIEETSLGAEESAAAFKEIAGAYYVNGYASSGKKPEKFEDMKEYQDKVNEEGVTISEDGILRIEGEEYQLLAQKIEKNPDDKTKGDKLIFSVKDCGFSIENYEKKRTAAKKDYDGYAVLEYTELPSYVDDEGVNVIGYNSLTFYYSPKGKTTAPISISLDSDQPEKNYKDPLTDESKEEFIKRLAGSYTFNYGMNNSSNESIERYADPSSDEVKKIFADDPVTISEDGVLHFDGKDYQLEPQEYDSEKDAGFLSVEGCGFSLKEYKNGIGLDVAEKGYSGVALVTYGESSFTVNDQTTVMPDITVYLTNGESESACVSFNFSGEEK